MWFCRYLSTTRRMWPFWFNEHCYTRAWRNTNSELKISKDGSDSEDRSLFPGIESLEAPLTALPEWLADWSSVGFSYTLHSWIYHEIFDHACFYEAVIKHWRFLFSHSRTFRLNLSGFFVDRQYSELNETVTFWETLHDKRETFNAYLHRLVVTLSIFLFVFERLMFKILIHVFYFKVKI